VRSRGVSERYLPFWIHSNLADILCAQDERVVANDNTAVSGRSLQIPSDRYRFRYVKVTVRVQDCLDGTLAVFHGPRAWRCISPMSR
jgi:hypothetical protein